MNILKLISQKFQNKQNIILVILFLIYGLFFIAFLPWPSGINWGLDPSWAWGISKVAKDNLIFGQDIVFTYGPFGYLIDGAAFDDNYWQILSFRFLIHFLFFIIFATRLLIIKDSNKKIIFLLLIIISIYLTKYIPTDYKILFTYLAIFTFDKTWHKYKKELTYFISIIIGFYLLTKFTLGVATLGFFLIYTSINLFNSIRLKSVFEIKNNIICLISFFAVSISSTWLFLIPKNFFPLLILIIINIILSALISSSISSLVNNKNIINLRKNYLTTIFKDKKFTKLFTFLLTYGLLTTIIIFFDSSQSLINYLYNCWQISSGYSSAMSLNIASNKELFLLLISISIFFLMIFIFYSQGKNGYFNFSLGLLFVTWIAFKHGFVRSDGHVCLYFLYLLFIFPLCLLTLKNANQWKNFLLIYLYIVIIAFITINQYFPSNISIFDRLNNSFRQIMIFNHLKENNNKNNTNILSQIKMSDETQKLLANKSIDIIPWDLVLVPANNLNWKPRPIFQSYSAYTKHLDNLNYQSFIDNPKDFILYSFKSIDGRHPFFDEPKTFSFVYCNYNPVKVIHSLNKTLESLNETLGGKFFLLQKQDDDRCLSTGNRESSITQWGKIETLGQIKNSLIKAEIHIKYSLLGKLYKTIFRASPVMVKVKYQDDYETEYRIIPENANNGVFLSHLPRDSEQSLLFLSGQEIAKVKSFSFHNQNHYLYQKNIQMELNYFKIK